MTEKDRLTEGELLNEIDRARFANYDAVTQLKEIVKDYRYFRQFREDIIVEIKKQQKLIVTNAEITELSICLRDTSRQTLYETKLKRWLESKGFTVED